MAKKKTSPPDPLKGENRNATKSALPVPPSGGGGGEDCGCDDPQAKSVKSLDAPTKNLKYIGPDYDKGLVIGRQLFRPAHVDETEIEAYLEVNPQLRKYFKT